MRRTMDVMKPHDSRANGLPGRRNVRMKELISVACNRLEEVVCQGLGDCVGENSSVG